MNKNLLVTFENKDIEVLVLDEQILFNPYDVAECLDMTDSAVRMAISKMNEKQVKTVRNADVKDVDIRKLNNRGENFLTESGLYKLIFKSHKEEAERFQDWVTDEVLPTLRRSGVVVLEHAEPEAIDYQAKYGKYRIRKTFTESTDIRATYEEYAALSKIERDAHRIDNKDRIRNCKSILDVIETKIAENITTMRGSEVLALRELALDIQADITKLHNKRNSGIKSAQTKKIQQLESEDDEIDFFDGSFYCIHRHSYTANRLTDVKDGRKVKAAGYKVWLSRLNLSDFIPEELPNVNFNEKLRLTLGFVSVQTMDLDNQIKAIQDALADYYDFDDLLIEDLRVKRIDTVDTYEQGKIYVKLENI